MVSALNVALVLALVASLATAAIVAVVMTRRVLRPLDDLRAATGRLAAGRYDEPVALPNERELAALAADVNRLATALADTELRRAALIGDIAHEMRTPLTTITGYVEGFDDGLFTNDEMVATVSDEIARLRRLAADLAAVSRAEEGQLLLDLQPEDLSDIVETVTNRLRPQFDAKSVALVDRHAWRHRRRGRSPTPDASREQPPRERPRLHPGGRLGAGLGRCRSQISPESRSPIVVEGSPWTTSTGCSSGSIGPNPKHTPLVPASA